MASPESAGERKSDQEPQPQEKQPKKCYADLFTRCLTPMMESLVLNACKIVPKNPSSKAKDWSFLKALERHWPNLMNGDNLEFWARQWDKHGSLSGLDPQPYFKLALHLKTNSVIDTLLSKLTIAGYGPRDDKPYEWNKLQDKISDFVGQKVLLRCNERKGRFQVNELYICFDSQTHAIIPCPGARPRSDDHRPLRVLFPTERTLDPQHQNMRSNPPQKRHFKSTEN